MLSLSLLPIIAYYIEYLFNVNTLFNLMRSGTNDYTVNTVIIRDKNINLNLTNEVTGTGKLNKLWTINTVPK